jgi:Spy/CpxP family protein refolding chaperone
VRWFINLKGEFEMTFQSMLRATVFCSVCLAFSAPSLTAGEKGERKKMMEAPGGQEFDFIKKHEKELNLTGEQKKKIEALEEKSQKFRDKMKEDPDTRMLFKEVKEARQAGDEAKLHEIQKKIREHMQKQAGGEPPIAELKNILTPQQLIKLKELREAEGGGDMKGMRERRKEKAEGPAKPQERPDPNKGAPSLYDGEK